MVKSGTVPTWYQARNRVQPPGNANLPIGLTSQPGTRYETGCNYEGLGY